MSLMRIAARICAVEALKGKTLVGDNVLDSQIAALDVNADGTLRTDQEKRFIAVYADASKGGDFGETRALVPNGSTDFLFEIGIATTMLYTDPDTDETIVAPGIPATDDAFEFALDLTMRQIGDALTDPTNEWAELWRGMIHQYEGVERIRTSSDNKGVRLAAHQLKITADLFADPVRGVPLKPVHPLAQFFDKASAEPGMAPRVAMMQAALSGVEYDWQTALRRYGLTKAEGDAMLLTTPLGAEQDVRVVEVNAAPVTLAAPAALAGSTAP